MRISLNWLKEYINLDLDPTKISEYLTNTGLEVEGMEEIENIKGGLKGVVIGEVLSCEKHPNADRLNKAKVNIGKEDPLNIICGAPNVAVGQKVPVATIGTVLYSGDESYKIKKSKIRGEDSEGMICGEDELGLGESTQGIMVLNSDAKVGIDASDYFDLKDDVIFEIGLTPNRSDAMGYVGVARDLKTVLNHQGSNLEVCLPSVKSFSVDNTDSNVSVEVVDPELCPRYSGISISGLEVSPSPQWLANKLRSVGITPINNIVDVTNYILLETGHPLHAFDASKIKGNKIIVKKLDSKTKFITLDKVERELSEDDLMICNQKEGMCIAGVLGGIESGVRENTTDIFLESAYFNPVSVRKTAKRQSLNTDASFRFERGCDPNMTIYALKRAALLIKEIAGGNISSEIIDVYPKKINDLDVRLSYKKLDNLIGEKIEREIVKSILTDLEIEIVNSSKEGLVLKIPPFRTDVTREVDVIEEILRIYGFNSIIVPNKLNISLAHSTDADLEECRNTISNMLSSNGFSEIINNSITRSSYIKLIPELNKDHNVFVINPLSQDLDAMRQSLLFSGLENISYNINRKKSNLKMYEFGKTYHKIKDTYKEVQHLALLMSGGMNDEHWNLSHKKISFFDLKEKVELILNRLGINQIISSEITGNSLSEGLIYQKNKKTLVHFGKVNRKITKTFNIKQDVYYADFNWDMILGFAQGTNVEYSEVSKFPSVRRDLSLLLNKEISFDTLKEIARNTEKEILKSVNLFDVYEGEKLPEGKKSYAISFVLEDKTQTLTDQYIDKIMSKLIKSYETKVGAEVRTK